MKPAVLIVTASGLILSGCASDVANRFYSSENYPVKDQEQVEILRTKPDREFIIIADFQSRGETARDMQYKAAKVGADAVIVSYLGGYYYRGDQWAGNDNMVNSYSHIVGTAIHYK